MKLPFVIMKRSKFDYMLAERDNLLNHYDTHVHQLREQVQQKERVLQAVRDAIIIAREHERVSGFKAGMVYMQRKMLERAKNGKI